MIVQNTANLFFGAIRNSRLESNIAAEPTETALAGDRNEMDAADLADAQRLKQGSEVALDNLMGRHGEKLFRYLIRCLQNEEDAADLAQETFLRVFQKRDRFDGKHSFSTWLYTIATNLVKDRYRYRSRHPKVSLDAENASTGVNLSITLSADQPIPSENIQIEERKKVIQEAIAGLPDDLRTPLILSEYEELSHNEIAGILKCSAKAIEMRIYRARQQLRTTLAHLLEENEFVGSRGSEKKFEGLTRD